MSLFGLRVSGWQLSTLFLAGLLLFIAFPATAQDKVPASPIMVPNPATDLWRAVRQREGAASGQTQVRGIETGVLIEQRGEAFREYRRRDFIGNAGIFIGVIAGLVLLFYILRGRINIPGGRSGRRIKRFADFERTLHWFTAIVFIFLALTGLTLLFGRFVVLPVFGAEAFGVIASACKEGHNLFGPLFIVAVVLLFIRFAWRNLPSRGDLTWLVKGGGIIGKAHVTAGFFNAGEKIWFWSVMVLGLAVFVKGGGIIGKAHVTAGFFNAGEKIWFWSVMVLGLAVSISGLVLIFPTLGQPRDIMQLALFVHGIAAVLFIAGSFGHIYIGTIGTEGSLESMTTGYVDENWAEAHHDRWHAETVAQAARGADRHASADTTGAVHATTDKA